MNGPRWTVALRGLALLGAALLAAVPVSSIPALALDSPQLVADGVGYGRSCSDRYGCYDFITIPTLLFICLMMGASSLAAWGAIRRRPRALIAAAVLVPVAFVALGTGYSGGFFPDAPDGSTLWAHAAIFLRSPPIGIGVPTVAAFVAGAAAVRRMAPVPQPATARK